MLELVDLIISIEPNNTINLILEDRKKSEERDENRNKSLHNVFENRNSSSFNGVTVIRLGIEVYNGLMNYNLEIRSE